VTETDLASERAIVAVLASETPGVPVQGEEGSEERPSGTGPRWVVDPLDGTTNFIHGFWAVGVSVALVRDSQPVAACVHAPFLGETYAAASRLGAWKSRVGEEPTALGVSDREPQNAVLGTGFPFRHKDRLPRYLAVLADALETFEDLRRPGAAALDLAWVAAGIFDGFFELGLAPWDVAAGGLLIQEAGGVVTDWQGGSDYLSGNILAGSPKIHAALLDLVERA
jgi:myo-inositol-1(or 4)-monophosphatase